MLTILSINFVLLKLAPSHPPATEEERSIYFERQVRDGYMTKESITDPDRIAKIKEQKATGTTIKGSYYVEVNTGDDRPETWLAYEPISIAEQYFSWLKNILRWDWGLSTRIAVNKPAFEVLSSRMATTLTLNLIALFFYIPIGLALGVIAALNKDKPLDNFISFAVMIMISVPSFVVIILLVLLFGYNLDWLPSIYPAADAALDIRIKGLVIPVMAMSFGPIAGLTRTTRAELTEVLTSEFLLLARTKGLTRPQAVVRHAMRNSMVPLVPGIIFSFVGILSGSVVIEQIYAIPGTGKVFLQALTKNAYDYNVLLASTAFYTIISLTAVLIVDLTYGLIDPRIRMGGRK